MLPLHPSAVPARMIERATARRLAGDWRGACAAAGVDVEVDSAALKRAHGAQVAADVDDELRHLVPDLLRWHLPRRPADGLLRTGLRLPLALFPDAHALVARPPDRLDRPQRIALRFERLDGTAVGRRDDALLHLRDRWDSRRTARLLARCGGETRLPFFTATGERLDTPGGDGPEGLVERAVLLDEGGRHAQAWAAAGFTLEVLLFDEGWSRDRIDPAAFGPGRTGAERDEARRAVVEQSLTWLRPLHAALAGAAGWVVEHIADLRRTGLAEPEPGHEARSPAGGAAARRAVAPPRPEPMPVGVDTRSGLVRIDLRGRCIVLDRFDTGRPRARLVAGVPYGRVDEGRVRAEVAEFGLPLDRVPRLPHVLARRPEELTALLHGRVRPDQLHPLVHAALFPAGTPPTPPAPPKLRDRIRVHCDDAVHEVLLRDGAIRLDHPPEEIRRERMIKAFGGRVQGCVAAHDGWRDATVRLPGPMRGLRREFLTLALHGDGPAVAAALDGGLDPHVCDERGRTLLHLLPRLSDVDLLPRLLAAGLDVNARDLNGETPLHPAVDHGPADLVRALLAAGADPQARSSAPYPRVAIWTGRPDLEFLRSLNR
ncbi:ankyrin repeat domain-containing protein [Dactylosporangium sp. NPDC049525]|uniref:ankyrin repeat domain-containing protein n=1 Tax=Dactylosporangium sp. NPDC049525 TaxID=3154730 RepID=UPI00342E5C41